MATTARTAENFSINQGANLNRTLTVTTDGSTAYDISGLTLSGQMRKSYASESASATFTISIVSGTAGTYKIQLANSTTTSLDEGINKTFQYIKRRGVRPFDYNIELEIKNELTPSTWKNKEI